MPLRSALVRMRRQNLSNCEQIRVDNFSSRERPVGKGWSQKIQFSAQRHGRCLTIGVREFADEMIRREPKMFVPFLVYG